MEILHINTQARCELVDITQEIQEKVYSMQSGKSGIVVIYSPHTTCGLTVNEGADPDVARDMMSYFSQLVPEHNNFRHMEGNSDAHIKTSIFGPSLTLIVENGRVQLGTWQHIYLCESDGPRQRKLWLQFVGS